MWALLLQKYPSMTREQFMDLDDWAIVNVYCRPNSNEGDPFKGYWPVARMDPEDPVVSQPTFREMYFDVWRKRGLGDEEIEAKFKVWYGGYNG